MTTQAELQRIVDRYVDAKDFVIGQGFESEIDWQDNIEFSSIDESSFLREGAWVILNAGMRERTVRQKFPAICEAFLDFRSATDIVSRYRYCQSTALSHFNHSKKIDAILSMSFRVSSEGYRTIQRCIQYYGTSFLESFDFLGPKTSRHLAKNLGIKTSKPDRHMCRIANICGFSSVEEMCDGISQFTGDSIPVVDIVIWRFATLRKNYEHWFSLATNV